MDYQEYEDLLLVAQSICNKKLNRSERLVAELNVKNLMNEVNGFNKTTFSQSMHTLTGVIDFLCSADLMDKKKYTNYENFLKRNIYLKSKLYKIIDNSLEILDEQYNNNKYIFLKNSIYESYFKKITID
jgi:hypothetical protein